MVHPSYIALGIATVCAATSVTLAASRSAAQPILVSREVPPVSRPASKPAPISDPAAYTVKHILPIKGPMRMGDFHWDESAAPKSGRIIITVDLAAQVISIFRDGYEIGTAAVLYGADAKPTPTGVYPITQKDADHVSNIYNAPMPYMLRLTNDGISIHASEVRDGYMTHGCIGVPEPFAKKLFNAVKLGDTVIVTHGEKLSVGQPVTAA
ncbi:L,D-transpeptidase family protein [uncultured Sphingomonas sp.]|uniref:L,D-transpeptidase family protein n=1 Tax=uncultured Sphingomonas sp. TaxID=158754 RepID=UPI0026163C4E|nr:L,D-transpeptidase family protein [uncultured Sphingomonas sp.]